MKKLIVTATTAGKTSIEAFGMSGPECLQKSAPIERALGTVESRTDKPEMHEIAPQLAQHLHLPA